MAHDSEIYYKVSVPTVHDGDVKASISGDDWNELLKGIRKRTKHMIRDLLLAKLTEQNENYDFDGAATNSTVKPLMKMALIDISRSFVTNGRQYYEEKFTEGGGEVV